MKTFREWRKQNRQREKLNCDVVTTKASADPMGSCELGGLSESLCIKVRGWGLYSPSSTYC